MASHGASKDGFTASSDPGRPRPTRAERELQSRELEPHREVDRAHVLRERADEMKSTPVSAIARSVSSVTPPDASSLIGPLACARLSCDGRAQVVERELVEQRHVGARIERLAQLVERFDFHFDRDARVLCRRAAPTAARDRAGRDDVVLLDQDAVVETDAMIAATAAAHRVFLRACAGRAGSCACRGSGTAVPAIAST